jgi:thiol-disulfide isomerase/thioredoxin
MSRVINITSQEQYYEFKHINKKAIIFYGADWCPGCTMVKPLYQRIAARYGNMIAMGYIDVDICKPNFDVVPVFVAYFNEKQVNALRGGKPDELKALIRDTIKIKMEGD